MLPDWLPETVTVTVTLPPVATVRLDALIVMTAVLALSWQDPPQSYSSVPLATPPGRAVNAGAMATSSVARPITAKRIIFFLKVTHSPVADSKSRNSA
jgi:hypothetical protein